MDGDAPLFSDSGRSRRMGATGSHCLPLGAPPSDPADLSMGHVLPSSPCSSHFHDLEPSLHLPQEFRSPVLLPQTQEIQSPCPFFCRIQVSSALLPGSQKFKPEASSSSLLSRLRRPDPVFLGTMKLSAIAMAVVVIYPAYFLLVEKKWKEIVIYLSMGIFIFAPYLIRNIILSGWLIYPFEAIDLFDVAWKVPLEYLLVDAYQIKTWGRALFDIALIDMSLGEWFPIWWEFQERFAQMLLGGNILGLLLAGFNFYYKWIKKIEVRMELVVLYLGLIVSAVVWFFMAPFIRYGMAFLLVIPLLGIANWYDYDKKGLQSIITGGLVFCSILCLTPYIDNYVTDLGVFIKQNLKEPYYIVAKDYDYGTTGSVELNGNTFYYNDYVDVEIGQSLISTANSVNSQTITAGN